MQQADFMFLNSRSKFRKSEKFDLLKGKPIDLVEIYFDGGSRGNQNNYSIAGSGSLLKVNGETIAECVTSLGNTTNNVAEYTGLIMGLFMATRLENVKRIEVYGDSNLVIQQMAGRFKVKNEGLQKMNQIAKDFKSKLNAPVIFKHIPRENNKEADALSNKGMDLNSEYK